MRQSYVLQAYEKHMGLWRSLASEPLRWGVPGQHQRAFSALCFPPTNPPPPRRQKLGRGAVFLDRIVKVMAPQRSKKNVNAAARSVLKPALRATHSSVGCLRGAGSPGRANLSKAIAGQVPAEFALGAGRTASSWRVEERRCTNSKCRHRRARQACCLGQQAAVVHSVISGRSRSQTNKCIEHQLVDLQAVVERALARAKCSLGWNSNGTDAGLTWRRLDVVDELRHTPFEEVG